MKLNSLSKRASGNLLDIYNSHSVDEARLKSGLNTAAIAGRQGLSKVVKSDVKKTKSKMLPINILIKPLTVSHPISPRKYHQQAVLLISKNTYQNLENYI